VDKREKELQKEKENLKCYRKEAEQEVENIRMMVIELTGKDCPELFGSTDREESHPFTDITSSAHNEDTKDLKFRSTEVSSSLKHVMTSLTQLTLEENMKNEKERNELKLERLKLEEEYIKSNKKKGLIKERVDKINTRQKKIQDRERLLTEK
jgi:predicted nucleotidyltransferase